MNRQKRKEEQTNEANERANVRMMNWGNNSCFSFFCFVSWFVFFFVLSCLVFVFVSVFVSFLSVRVFFLFFRLFCSFVFHSYLCSFRFGSFCCVVLGLVLLFVLFWFVLFVRKVGFASVFIC